MGQRPPVSDWATDFDHLTDEWAAHGPEILDDLRPRCPVLSTERFHGAYIATRYADAIAVAQDTATFSSRVTMVTDAHPDTINLSLGPLTLDPPLHAPLRRALLPAFNPHRVAELEAVVQQIVEGLLDDLGDREHIEAASEFAEQVPVRLMSHLFGVPVSQGAAFKGWVDAVLKEGLLDIQVARDANRAILSYFAEKLRSRRESGEHHDDLISTVIEAGPPGSRFGSTGSRSFRCVMAATSRAIPKWPQRSGRCVRDLLSTSMMWSDPTGSTASHSAVFMVIMRASAWGSTSSPGAKSRIQL